MAVDLNQYEVDDIQDPFAVRIYGFGGDANAVFIPVAEADGSTGWAKVSIASLSDYVRQELEAALQISISLGQAADARNALGARISALEVETTSGLNALTGLESTLRSEVDTNSATLRSLLGRVAALEAGQSGQPTASGTVTYGLRDSSGTPIGAAATASYPRLPSSVLMNFPAATALGQLWYATLPSGTVANHIFNEGFTPTDELSEWTWDAGTRTYTSPALTPGLTGRYSISLVSDGG